MQDFRNIFLLIITLVIFYIIFFIIIVNKKTSKYEKKFHNFALSTKPENQSLLDLLNGILWKFINKISNIFSKFKFLEWHSKNFDKYISYDENENIRGIDILSGKIVLSLIVFIIILIISLIGLFEIPYVAIVFFSISFYFVPNIILNIRYNKKRDDVLNDILDAVTIINTSLHNGENFYNSVSHVVKELDGAIRDEFKKIISDLDYGLSICETFARFDKRINLNITHFICKTLYIFDQKDIEHKEVFDYIEKEINRKLYIKNKSKNECMGIKILVFMVLLIPFILGIILILKPKYIKYIINNPHGLFGFLIIISLITLYGVIACKIMGDDL